MKIREVIKEINLKQIQRWTLFGIVIGIVSGFAAVLFYMGISAFSHYIFGGISGYYPPSPSGELSPFTIPQASPNIWLLLILPAAGGLIAGIIIYTFAPEAEGHGTDAVIDAYNNKRGFIRKRVPVIKAITSVITIGSGGSAGREGPIAQIGAGFGSALASFMKLSDRDRRIMVICGMAAGIGSIFNIFILFWMGSHLCNSGLKLQPTRGTYFLWIPRYIMCSNGYSFCEHFLFFTKQVFQGHEFKTTL
ncbi:MAG: chloride channel protein [Euryarchaeota archaeon]|nr:chloride channel protein [Euryarchaeota archaeon]MBU4340847.1 chloride channel protein [Euryarchaeota archaeon]